jgi:hypothetical protein
VVAEPTMGILIAADPPAGEAVIHLRDAAALLHVERAVPLRDALQLLLGEHDRWLTHAGAAGQAGSGALLVGRSGSGKSTLALSCATAGMDVLSDDYVVIETRGTLRAHATQSTAKLSADSASRLGLSKAVIHAAGFEATPEGPAKAAVDIRDLTRGTMPRALRVAALIAPTLSDQPRPQLKPITSAEAMRALAPSTVLQARSGAPGLLAAMGRIVREAPGYSLRLGPDPSANAAEVARVVDRHA